jgi:hypothetical protein
MTYLINAIILVIGVALGFRWGRYVEKQGWIKYLTKYRTQLKTTLMAEIIAKAEIRAVKEGKK